MTLDIRAGRILITDGSGATKLDTNGALFHGTDVISGSITIPQRVSSAAIFENREAHALGPCLAAATHVIGSFRVSGGGGSAVLAGGNSEPGFPADKWFTAGGTYLHFMHPYATTNSDPNSNDFPRHIVHYTFGCRGGTVYLDEVTSIGAGSGFLIRQHTISYRLKAGLFT